MPTVEDTRIDEIGKIILDHRYEKDPRDMNALKYSSYLIAKKALEYLAPELEKSEKYDALCLIRDPIQVEREYFQELVEKAEKWDRARPLLVRIATLHYNCSQIIGSKDILTTHDICQWEKEAEEIVYGKVGGYIEAMGWVKDDKP